MADLLRGVLSIVELVKILQVWPGAPEGIRTLVNSHDEQTWQLDDLHSARHQVAEFYCQSFFQEFARAPTIPSRWLARPMSMSAHTSVESVPASAASTVTPPAAPGDQEDMDVEADMDIDEDIDKDVDVDNDMDVDEDMGIDKSTTTSSVVPSAGNIHIYQSTGWEGLVAAINSTLTMPLVPAECSVLGDFPSSVPAQSWKARLEDVHVAPASKAATSEDTLASSSGQAALLSTSLKRKIRHDEDKAVDKSIDKSIDKSVDKGKGREVEAMPFVDPYTLDYDCDEDDFSDEDPYAPSSDDE
ncbi:hypothetical protein FISHEDRAFT_54926 [Fistulina hepatica ATCC 64428]|uniref:Uncharacterized protein n=1 Tax=Fistulina hepatica ATCC 64428 TaxID=1128425 RepID=A0A0D7APM4_9AGAR|nr:hypothetical protein FISHEDRAFT_54926 [Fistulina hepatica ATCC 64428]